MTSIDMGDFASWTSASWKSLVPDIESDEALIGPRLGRVSTAYRVAKDRALRRYAGYGIVGFDDFRALSIIRRTTPPGITSSELADMLGATRGATSNRIDRFENEGHIVRHKNPRDRRSHTIELSSEEAIALVDDMYRTIVAVHEEFFAPLTAEQRRMFADLLRPLSPTWPPAGSPYSTPTEAT